MRVMRSLGAALIWLLGVVLVASVSWVAINSAGRQVADNVNLAAGDPWAGGTPGDSLTPTSAPTPSSASTRPPDPSGSPTGHGTAQSTTSGPVHSATGSTRASQSSVSPSTSPSTTRPTGPAPVSATQQTNGGSVWMECTGQTVTNSLALPNDGWSATRSQRTPSDLTVRFSRSTTRIDVAGSCVAGQPHFDVGWGHGED
jgi:hypothetical protein